MAVRGKFRGNPLIWAGLVLLGVLGLFMLALSGRDADAPNSRREAQVEAEPADAEGQALEPVRLRLAGNEERARSSAVELAADEVRPTVLEPQQPSGHRLRVSAMWGSVAPISHQGFQVEVVPFVNVHAEAEAQRQGLLSQLASLQSTMLESPSVESQALREELWSKLEALDSRMKEDRKAQAGPWIVVSDAAGQLTFEDLPAGTVSLAPLGEGFLEESTIRSFKLEQDMSYDYVAPAGLSYAGRLSGELGEHFQAQLRSLEPGQRSRTNWGRMSIQDGSFVFRGLTPGRYALYLYDSSRWEVVHRYAPFTLKEDVFDALYSAPLSGSLEVQVWELPEHLTLVGSYLNRVSEQASGADSALWMLNEQVSASRMRFEGIPLGEYELHLRAAETEGSLSLKGQTLAILELSIAKDQNHLEWTYEALPRIWLRLLADEVPDASGQEPQVEGLEASGESRLPASSIQEWTGIPRSLQELGKEPQEPGSAELEQRLVAGDFVLSSADGRYQEQRGFLLLKGQLIGTPNAKPFDDYAIPAKPGCIGLLLPFHSGYLDLEVRAPGFHTEKRSFALQAGEVIEVRLTPASLPRPPAFLGEH